MVQKRRRYTNEFKVEAVKLVTEQGYRISDAARSLGINENMLWRWKHEQSKKKEKGDRSTSGIVAMEAEVRRLQKENARLKMEHEILKKAAAFFAKDVI